MLTDHRNNLFTNAMRGNRRINKKILRWSLDIEDFGDRIAIKWVRGVDNILGDGVSRNPPDRDAARSTSMPGGPVKRVMRRMFERPRQTQEEWEAFESLLETLGDEDVDRSLARSVGREESSKRQPARPPGPVSHLGSSGVGQAAWGRGRVTAHAVEET